MKPFKIGGINENVSIKTLIFAECNVHLYILKNLLSIKECILNDMFKLNRQRREQDIPDQQTAGGTEINLKGILKQI